ncbi:hypothetical protein FHS86_003002 [Roseimarinus sediminis]
MTNFEPDKNNKAASFDAALLFYIGLLLII